LERGRVRLKSWVLTFPLYPVKMELSSITPEGQKKHFGLNVDYTPGVGLGLGLEQITLTLERSVPGSDLDPPIPLG